MASTYQSEFGELQSVMLKHVSDAYRNEKYVSAHWQQLNYSAKPDFNKAIEEYEAFMEIFVSRGIAVQMLNENEGTGLDSIYVRDASITTDLGALICQMGKPQRSGEPYAQLENYLKNGEAILGTFDEDTSIEGGDVAWLREDILAVAHGYRTNLEGINRLRSYLALGGVDVVVMDSPHYKGPMDVFHLMSVLSPVDKDLAVVYSPLMTVPFRNLLIKLGYSFVEVPDEEFETQGCNVLAIAPRVCVMLKGNPITKKRLEQAGVEVIEFSGEEISVKGAGGPTCLTRPLLRSV